MKKRKIKKKKNTHTNTFTTIKILKNKKKQGEASHRKRPVKPNRRRNGTVAHGMLGILLKNQNKYSYYEKLDKVFYKCGM